MIEEIFEKQNLGETALSPVGEQYVLALLFEKGLFPYGFIIEYLLI